MIVQIPLTNGDIFRRYGLVENRIFHGIGRKDRQIPCCGIMSGAVQTVGIFKVRTGHAKDSCLVIHQLRKAFHCAAAVNGKCHSRIVSGRKHQSVQQRLQGENFSLLQVHGRAFDAHRFLGNPHTVKDVALLTDDQRRHNLGGACNEAAGIRILLINHTTADGIQQNRLLGRNCPRFQRQKQSGGQQCSRRSGEKSFHTYSPEESFPGMNRIILPSWCGCR